MGETERPAQHIVLLLTDLVGSAALKTRFGTATYADLISRHDELFRGIVSSIAGPEIVKDTGDGFLTRFATTRDAVDAALRFQYAIHIEAWEPQTLQVRIGVHVGDVLHLDKDIDGRPKLVGLTADITARLTELALPGQILMTRSAFDDARQYVHEHPLVDPGVSERPRLKWMAHGTYLFKGVDEPVEVFEVGAAGLAPVRVPPSGGKAQRIVLADEEETLGWRPAVGLDVPQRENWRLQRKLGEGGFGEVWLAQNRQTHVERVFKFCFDAERVRSLKREVTLFRLLRDALANRELTEFHRLDYSIAHSDVGLDSDGREVIVMQSNQTDYIDLIPLDPSTQPILEPGGSYESTGRVPLIRLFFESDSPLSLNSGVHISCNLPGYCLVSTFTEPNRPEQNWLDRTITLVRLDPRDPRVFYLAKVYGTAGAYWEETHASISRDGSRVVWATNWSQNVGQEQVWLMQLDLPAGGLSSLKD